MSYTQNKLKKEYNSNSINCIKTKISKGSPCLSDSNLQFSKLLSDQNIFSQNNVPIFKDLGFNFNCSLNRKVSNEVFEDANNKQFNSMNRAIKATVNPFQPIKSCNNTATKKLPSINNEFDSRERPNSNLRPNSNIRPNANIRPNSNIRPISNLVINQHKSCYNLKVSNDISIHSKTPQLKSSNEKKNDFHSSNNRFKQRIVFHPSNDSIPDFYYYHNEKIDKSASLKDRIESDLKYNKSNVEIKVEFCNELEEKVNVRNKFTMPIKLDQKNGKSKSFAIKSTKSIGNLHADNNNNTNSDKRISIDTFNINRKSFNLSENYDNNSNDPRKSLNNSNLPKSKFDQIKDKKGNIKQSSVKERNNHALYRPVNKNKSIWDNPKDFDKKVERKKSFSDLLEENDEILKNIETIDNHNFFSLSAKTIKGYCSEEEKINQDSYIMKFDFIERSSVLLGVFDGHGTYGHFISQYVKKNFTSNLIRHSEIQAMMNEKDKFEFKDQNDVKKLIENTYRITSNDLFSKIRESDDSGSTGVSILIANNKIYTANIGDSEAGIIFYDDNLKKYDIKMLTKPHLANNPIERDRIERSGGRVEQCKDSNGKYIGPYRVWPKNSNTLGLMMTRSFGDKLGHDIGMIDIPSISVEKKTDNIIAVIVASDGIWEVCTMKQIVEIVTKYYEAKDSIKAVAEISEFARLKWVEDDDTYVDDITAIIGYIK